MKNTPTPQQSVQSPDSENPHQANQPPIPPGEANASSGAAPPGEPASPEGNDEVEENETELPRPSEEQLPPAAPTAHGGDDGGGAVEVPSGYGSHDSEVDPIEKEKTVPVSIRLWESAFAALKVLKAKYHMNKADMASTAIHAYGKKSAAAPTVRYRILDLKWLFSLQASANDIKQGLSNLEEDLFDARKSHRDPEERKALYDLLGERYSKVFDHADQTLTLMDKECLLNDLLKPDEHERLLKLIEKLENEEPKSVAERKIRDLQLKIFKTLIL